MFAEDEARLLAAAASGSARDELVRRRVAGEPLEHVLGWVEFCGLRLAVGPGVFVPRQRTALLARLAVAAARQAGVRPVVVELCCGAAPVACVVRHAVAAATIHAADVDPVAVAYARRNLGARGEVGVGDLFDPLPSTLLDRVDVLVANTPYVPSGEIASMPVEAREHEPRAALDGGGDGLDVHRRVAARVTDWLAPGGTVLVEVARAQAATSAGLFAAAGLTVTVDTDDDLGAVAVRAVRAVRPAAGT